MIPTYINLRIEYLEGLLPPKQWEVIDKKYRAKFEKQATYRGNGVYEWGGNFSQDTRELYLMGVLGAEGVKYDKI